PPKQMKTGVPMASLDGVERSRDEGNLSRRAALAVLARGAIDTGPAQMQIRKPKISRPTCRKILHLGRCLLDVIAVGSRLSPPIGRNHVLRQPHHHFGSTTAGGRVIVADAFPLPFRQSP